MASDEDETIDMRTQDAPGKPTEDDDGGYEDGITRESRAVALIAVGRAKKLLDEADLLTEDVETIEALLRVARLADGLAAGTAQED